jgi:hypothetical protein
VEANTDWRAVDTCNGQSSGVDGHSISIISAALDENQNRPVTMHVVRSERTQETGSATQEARVIQTEGGWPLHAPEGGLMAPQQSVLEKRLAGGAGGRPGEWLPKGAPMVH